MARLPRTFPDPKPYTVRIYEALSDHQIAGGGVDSAVSIPVPNNDDERQQLAAFMSRWRRCVAKGEAFDYAFVLEDGIVVAGSVPDGLV